MSELLMCRCATPMSVAFAFAGIERHEGSPHSGLSCSRSRSNDACEDFRYMPAEVSRAMRDDANRFAKGAHTGASSPGNGPCPSYIGRKLRGRNLKLSTITARL